MTACKYHYSRSTDSRDQNETMPGPFTLTSLLAVGKAALTRSALDKGKELGKN